MAHRKPTYALSFALLFALAVPFVTAQELKPIALPQPRTEGGKPLMQALSARKSTRAFSPENLSRQVLADLLWAADGINRSDGRRTAPSASNRQEIDIYVAISDGVYLYDAKGNTLKPVAAGDLRAATGGQDFVRSVPVNLVYVADFERMGNAPEEEKVLYSAADAGFIGQNVYLYCASEGLGAVVRGTIDRPALAKALSLRPGQRILLAHSVGYPKK
jgi:SagB-type dehydrogenase family enzyme